MPQFPIPPIQPPSKDNGEDEGPFAKVMLKLVDQMGSTKNAPITDDSARAEVAKLHALINSLNEAHATEKINTLAAHREDMDKRIREQSAAFEKTIKEISAASQETVASLKEQHRIEAENAREGHKERTENLREQLKDTKQDLRDLRTESRDDLRKSEGDSREEIRKLQGDLTQAQADLAQARQELATAKSQYEALQITKGSELETRIAQVKMEAMEEARKDERQRLDREKRDQKDPIEQMQTSVELAKTLATSLGAKFGLGDGESSTDAAKPSSRLDQVIDVVTKVGGSPEVRKLAGTVTKGLAEGVGSVLKNREEAHKASKPSTTALTSAWQQGQRPAQTRQQQPDPLNDIMPESNDQQVVGNEVADAIDAVSDAIPDMETIQSKANPMLDDIEDHCLMNTPAEEAAEEMISKLIDMLGRSREEVLSGMPDATAAKTLEELEFPESRLSPGAVTYMDGLIQYAAQRYVEEFPDAKA